jgi:DnaJ-related protein SCJ1
MKIILLLLLVSHILAGRNYYEVLGVDKDSSKKAIKKAYKNLSKKYHPDKNKEPDAQDKFVELAKAYEVLIDDEKRRVYDQYGEAGLENGGQQFHDPFDIFAQYFYKIK